ncbi:MAG: hypothetical protein AAGE18_12435 [Pseudomonadota bacterium]
MVQSQWRSAVPRRIAVEDVPGRDQTDAAEDKFDDRPQKHENRQRGPVLSNDEYRERIDDEEPDCISEDAGHNDAEQREEDEEHASGLIAGIDCLCSYEDDDRCALQYQWQSAGRHHSGEEVGVRP